MASETLAVTLLLKAGQYKREAQQAATATGQIGTQATATGTATGNLERRMGGLATTAKFAVAGVAAGAVAKFGKDSVQAFLGFDDAMNQSLAIMGDVSQELRDDMASAAREIGKTTRISAEEAAEAYFFLASAGLDAEQSIAALPQVAAFAQAGMFDMARATDLATDAQSALGLTVDDAGQNLANLTRVTDVLVGANTIANASVEQFSEALTNRAGAAMRAVGMDIEEGVAVLAAFADQGVKGAEAGTQFSIVLRDLQTKALENKDAFEAAGISVFDAQGNLQNFGDILGDVENRLSGMSDEQKRAELSVLGFSDRSIAAITVLLGTADAMKENEAAARGFGGAVKDVADKQLESFQGQLDLLKGRVEDAQIAIGEGMVPALIDMADGLMPVIELVGTLSKGVSALRDSSDSLREAEDPFSNIVGMLAAPQGALATFIQVMGEFGDAWGEWTGNVEEAGRASGSSAGEIDVLAGAASDGGDAAADAADDHEDLADALDKEAEAAKLAAASERDLLNAYREAASPVFAAQQALERLRSAEEKLITVQEDTESTAQDIAGAQLDVAAASLEAEDALLALGDGRVEDGVAAIATALGIGHEEAEGLLETLRILDGGKTTHTVNVGFTASGSRAAQAAITGTTSANLTGNTDTGGGELNVRHSGGPALAGEAHVWRPGEEMFIPTQDGVITSRSDTDRLIAALSGGDGGGGPVRVVIEVEDDAFRAKVREANVQNGRLGLN